MTITPVDSGAGVSSILVGLWDDSPLDFTRFSVTVNDVAVTPQINASADIATVLLPVAVTDANAAGIEIKLEIWDSPNRSWSREQAGVPAANRTSRTITGQGLLRMLGNADAGDLIFANDFE